MADDGGGGFGLVAIIVLVFLLFTGRLSSLFASLSNSGIPQQALPGSPTGLPAMTTQNQLTGNPVTTPAPWVPGCQANAPLAVIPPGLGLSNSAVPVVNLPSTPVARPTGGGKAMFYQ